MKYVSNALLVMLTATLVSCGSNSKEEQELKLVKVENDNLPHAIVVRTDSEGNTETYQVFDSSIANLTEAEFNEADLVDLSQALTVSSLGVVDTVSQVKDAFAITADQLESIPSDSSVSNYGGGFGGGFAGGFGGGVAGGYVSGGFGFGGGLYGYGYGYSFPYSYGYGFGFRGHQYSIYSPAYGYGYGYGGYEGGYGFGGGGYGGGYGGEYGGGYGGGYGGEYGGGYGGEYGGGYGGGYGEVEAGYGYEGSLY